MADFPIRRLRVVWGPVCIAIALATAACGSGGMEAPSGSSPPKIVSFSASPASIVAGQATTLSWTVTGATSVSIDPGVGPVTGATDRSVSPAQSTTYVLTASNAAGSVTATAAVGVTKPPAVYVTESRSIDSGGALRTCVLARPNPMPAGALPLVFSLHGDGGDGAGMRAGLPLEAQATGGAIFVYPNAPGGTFEYYTSDGRTREAQFVQDLIAALYNEFSIDRSRVFVTGMSGGATMANALACRLGPAVLRGVGIHSGTLYPVDNDFTYTGTGGVSCPLPAAIFVWGKSDDTPGVSYAEGQGVRDNYRATQACGSPSAAWTVNPCESYPSCTRAMVWCPIDGLGHAIWSGAAAAMWQFFDALR